MTTHEKIKAEIKTAMRNKDALRLAVVRGLAAAFTNEAVAKGKKPDELLTDEEALAVIRRAAKQRQDSIEQFKAGGRTDLMADEEAELGILQAYLPTQMSEAKIEQIAKKKIEELGPDAKKVGAGKLIGTLMRELGSRADGATVKAVVNKLLTAKDETHQ